jgi:hypothetical protein
LSINTQKGKKKFVEGLSLLCHGITWPSKRAHRDGSIVIVKGYEMTLKENAHAVREL